MATLSKRTQAIMEIAFADKKSAAELLALLTNINGDLKAITAKLDLDTGVTDENYAEVITDDNP